MAGKLRKLASAALAAIAVTVAVPGGSAWAINDVPCNNDGYLRVTLHVYGQPDQDSCYANAGFYNPGLGRFWITRIWTGNNRVQWYGDGRWQPEHPIDRWTSFTWPNHPGGVRMEGIRIM
ncbi:hypothetical protein FHS29_005047 [Saccharothrix tamanrassetensis]|uniref:Streptomyces killer toxin-like beta/gamma crystallin domain-containing protein n=1 Tax=Saccharothrix tamanrassetensis TaxID=1051531 RepID=A0A841CMB1_9PSEU|nr:beta/gamma crystallin domain-containing protein [Saccharothrix tamanrassetensis]MBB5958439.1 hypothetical protein [Saccharothrix tamanrassetensis]